MDVCSAFVTANLNNEKLSEALQEIVKNANKFILATAKIGIIALIDEVTGYQSERNSKELQLKMKCFLVDDMNRATEWEKTFPDDLWYEFGKEKSHFHLKMLLKWELLILTKKRNCKNRIKDY